MPCTEWGGDALQKFSLAFGAWCGFAAKTLTRQRTIPPATQAGIVSPQTDSSRATCRSRFSSLGGAYFPAGRGRLYCFRITILDLFRVPISSENLILS